MKKSEILSS
jgi:hypothetical protein